MIFILYPEEELKKEDYVDISNDMNELIVICVTIWVISILLAICNQTLHVHQSKKWHFCVQNLKNIFKSVWLIFVMLPGPQLKSLWGEIGSWLTLLKRGYM